MFKGDSEFHRMVSLVGGLTPWRGGGHIFGRSNVLMADVWMVGLGVYVEVSGEFGCIVVIAKLY